MLSVQDPPRTRVIEPLCASLGPFDEIEFLPGVIRVAARALGLSNPRMEAAPLLHEPADLLVTGNAPARHRFLPTTTVALRAVARTFE
jgi:hypothetical protein